jgi:uncharacterized protein YPO0396
MRSVLIVALMAAFVAGCGAVAQQAQAKPSDPVPSERGVYEARLQALSEHAATEIQAQQKRAQELIDEINRLNAELESVEPEVVEVPRVVVRTIEREVEVSAGDMDLEQELQLRKEIDLRTAQLQRAVEVIGQMDAAIDALSVEPDPGFMENYGWIITGFMALVIGVLVYDRFAEAK